MGIDRRDFVKFMGGSAAILSGLSGLTSCSEDFKGLAFSSADDLILADGFSSKVLISFGDKISKKDTFGANNDYTALIPLNREGDEVIMWVNHEYPDLPFGSKWFNGVARTKEMIDQERYSVGGSLLHLVKSQARGEWQLKENSQFNRRLNGETKIPIISDREIEGSLIAEGTFANCAGGVTPWSTILTCEENYFLFYGEREFRGRAVSESRLGWEKFYQNPPEHYGWVVEVNPRTGASKKLTGLGRFSHECATCVRTEDGRVAVYSGDDKNSEFLYKFISSGKDSLEKGELFVANIGTKKWMSLDIKKSKLLQDKFKDQTDILIHTRQAARLLGATELARPEDIEINPKTGEVFVCLTNNTPVGNYHGSILKISPRDGDHGAEDFVAQDFLVGGNDFSCPDNLAFDSSGNLWFATDISGGAMNKAPYEKFKNNGLFYVPMSGREAGKVFQIASAPTDAELTGLSFAPDGKTLFLSVQHPGEKSSSLQELTSHWPRGGESLPLSSVVAISGHLIKGS